MQVSATTWSTLSKLLDEALDLEPAARETWLERLSVTQPVLAPSVRKLLAAHAVSETADILAQLPPLPVRPDARLSALSAGDRIGPYRLKRELGSGGMADVWLAERADGAFTREVALKLPLINRLRRDLPLRFARERDILARLEHPNIARLYDAGVTDDGLPYLAMEYVDGQPITAYCDQHKLDIATRLRLFGKVLDAVQFAHASLIIHRDLKPSNTLVTADGQVRLLDFGIAKLLADDDTAQETQLTQLSGRALTPDYASPEQIKGEPLTIATDIYSLGVVLYELLAGVRPYRLKVNSAAQLEQAIIDAEAERASERAEERLRKRQLRGDIDAILAKSLKKLPAQRYGTAAAMAQDIERHLQGRPVLARPESRWYLTRTLIRRHKVPVAAGASVLIALSAGLATTHWQQRIAQQNLARAERTLQRESAVRELYVESFATFAAWNVSQFSEPRSAVRLITRKLEELEQRYKSQPEQRLSILNVVSQQLPYMGDYEGGLAVGQRYLDLLWTSDPHPSHLMLGYIQNATTLRHLGRLQESEVTLREAIDKVPRQHEAPVERARLYAELATALRVQSKRIEGIQVADVAIGWLEAEKGRSHSALWDAIRTRGNLYTGYDDVKALHDMRRAHHGVLSQPNAQIVQQGLSFVGLASALHRVGRPSEAETALREALSRFETIYGTVDRDTVTAAARLAHVIAAQARYDEARNLLTERLRMVKERVGPDTANALQTLSAYQLEVELLHGDVKAAAPFVHSADAKIEPTVLDKSIRPIAEARYFQWVGRPAEAVSRTSAVMSAPSNVGANSSRVRIALIESLWAAGDRERAAVEIDALLATQRNELATLTWSHNHATELAALALVAKGSAIDAAKLLETLDARKAPDELRAPTQAELAESVMRRAQVLFAAGQSAAAAALLSSIDANLQGQHPDSPRLAAARELKATVFR